MIHSKSKRLASVVVVLFSLVFTQPSYAVASMGRSALFAIGGMGILSGLLVSLLNSNDDSPGAANPKAQEEGSNSDSPGAANPKAQEEGAITAGGVSFTDPGSASLVITHSSGTSTVTVTDIVLDASIQGVTKGVIPDSCKNLSDTNPTCSIPLNATVDAYGSGQATITYSGGGGTKTTTATVSVAPAVLKLYSGDPSGGTEITENYILSVIPGPSVSINFYYKNIGNFSWKNPSVKWYDDFDTPNEYVVLQPDKGTNPCNNLASVAANGGTCTFALDYQKQHPGDWGTIQPTGANLGILLLRNIISGGGLSVAINNDDSDYHLGYRSVRVTNGYTVPGKTGTINITNILVQDGSPATGGGNVASTLTNDGVVKKCDLRSKAEATDCDGYNNMTNACPSSGILNSGESCLVWFKANEKYTANTSGKTVGDVIPLQTYDVNNGRIRVEVEGTFTIGTAASKPLLDYERISIFNATYSNNLYAGGDFAKLYGNNILNGMAKWDGNNWTPLWSPSAFGVTGAGATVKALATSKGDLYVGGSFTTAGGISASNIARWNGQAWSALGTGVSGGTSPAVYALTTDSSGNLYVGGSFSTASGIPNTVNVAMWDLNNTAGGWSALGEGLSSSSVGTLTFWNGTLVAGSMNGAFGESLPIIGFTIGGDTWQAVTDPIVGVCHSLASLGTYLFAEMSGDVFYIAALGASWQSFNNPFIKGIIAINPYYKDTGSDISVVARMVDYMGNSLLDCTLNPSTPGSSICIEVSALQWRVPQSLAFAGGNLYASYNNLSSTNSTGIYQGNSTATPMLLPGELNNNDTASVYAMQSAPSLNITNYYPNSATYTPGDY